MRTIAAVSVLAGVVALALLLWLFTRPEPYQQNPATLVPHAAHSEETHGAGSAAKRETIELAEPAPESLPRRVSNAHRTPQSA